MKKTILSACLLASMASLYSCSSSENEATVENEVSVEITNQLEALGFDVTTTAPFYLEGGQLVVEGDMLISENQLNEMKAGTLLPIDEQYSTDNLVTVSGTRNITLYADPAYDAAMIAGIDEAIRRYNAENLEITFSRVSSSNGADIVMSRLSRRDERRGVLGSAGFPTNGGDPYDEILMSGVLQSTYGLSTDGIATIVAHEIGHCIGFRHTDYFDRSISCGGATDNEGASDVGANHIPGTPTGATYSDLSFMLACTDGGDRPFNDDDKTALDYLY